MGINFDLLKTLIVSEITGETIKFLASYSARFEQIMKLAKKHDIAHIAADALLKNKLISDTNQTEYARKQVFTASYRDAKNVYTYTAVCDALNSAGIEFVPLKGAILKELYPSPWIRSSCDIDILVHREDFQKAVNELERIGFSTKGEISFHDISLLYDDTNLELHFSIFEDIECVDSVLKNVWDYTLPSSSCKRLETGDFFVFHHVAHMAKHFLSGGCGIRPFIDLWLLKRNNFYDESTVSEFCKKAGILKFYEVILQTVSVWFEGGEPSDLTDKIENYVLTGGVYGDIKKNYTVQTVKKGGKVHHIFAMVFPDKNRIYQRYPSAHKMKIFLPLFYVHRFFNNVWGRKRHYYMRKYKTIKNQDRKTVKNMRALLQDLELNK